ncbi:MAG TPA: RNA pyrophosphohydrolase [Gammaproteobacteria bacterium]|nr:RNA pyrophosphohydrolase [Gammaproteobacteria bacterium]
MLGSRVHTQRAQASARDESTDFIDEQGFRANVGIILTDGRGNVLLAGRRGRGGWQFPQGGIRNEEPSEAAMYRELREEVGLDPGDVDLVGATRGWLRYRLPSRYVRRERRPVCIGQKQQWFLLQLTAAPERLRFDLSEAPEFDRCRWVDYWRPVKEVIYFKRQVYVKALVELAPLAFPNNGPPAPPSWWPQRWQRALNPD